MPGAEDISAPRAEGWPTLTALACRIPRLRIGTLAMGDAFRHPAVLAEMAATLDHVGGGRLVPGPGAGWQENEHRRYGVTLHDAPGRLLRPDEA